MFVLTCSNLYLRHDYVGKLIADDDSGVASSLARTHVFTKFFKIML